MPCFFAFAVYARNSVENAKNSGSEQASEIYKKIDQNISFNFLVNICLMSPENSQKI